MTEVEVEHEVLVDPYGHLEADAHHYPSEEAFLEAASAMWLLTRSDREFLDELSNYCARKNRIHWEHWGRLQSILGKNAGPHPEATQWMYISPESVSHVTEQARKLI